MSKRRKNNATNSATLTATVNPLEAVTRNGCVVVDVTEDTAVRRQISKRTRDKEDGKCDALFTNMSDVSQFDFTTSPRLERYSQKVFCAIARKMKKTILIAGEEGCGKRTVIESVAQQIATGKCPKIFAEHKSAVYQVKRGFIAGNKDSFRANINQILHHAQKDKVENAVIYLGYLETEDMQVFKDNYDEIVDFLEESTKSNVKFIVLFNEGQYMSEDEDARLADFIRENTSIIKVEPEEDPKSILRLLKPRIDNLEKQYSVTCPYDVREVFFMCYYGRNYAENVNYRAFLHEVDTFMAFLSVKGKKIATHNDIKLYHRSSIEIMSKFPAGYNKATAIHESGHILLILTIPKLYKLLGASVLYNANDNIEAITMARKTQYVSYNEDDIIDYVAMVLAGRVAELEFCTGDKTMGTLIHKRLNVNRGSGCDLKDAAEVIRDWVVRNGVYRITGYNMYNDDYLQLSNVGRFKADMITKWLLSKSFNKAKYYVRTNRDFILTMSNFLLKNITATREQIFEIAKNTIKV